MLSIYPAFQLAGSGIGRRAVRSRVANTRSWWCQLTRTGVGVDAADDGEVTAVA